MVLMQEFRVAPVLKEQINAGKINLTAIVNTHQYAASLRINRMEDFSN